MEPLLSSYSVSCQLSSLDSKAKSMAEKIREKKKKIKGSSKLYRTESIKNGLDSKGRAS